MLKIQHAYNNPPPKREYMQQVRAYESGELALNKETDISALVENFQGIMMGQDPGYTSATYANMAREGYTFNPTVRSCVDIINNGLTSLPIYLMKTGGAPLKKALHKGRHPYYMRRSAFSTEEQPDSHPLLQLLKNPNPRMNKTEFLEFVGGSLLLGGDSIIVPVNPATRTGPPLALYPLRPDMVQVDEVMRNGILSLRYVYTPTMDGQPLGAPETYYDNEVIHIKLFNPSSGLRGLSAISAARMVIDRSNAGEKWNYATLKNGAKIPGVLTTDKEVNSNQKQSLEEKRDKMIGMLNAGKPPVLTNGVKWQNIALSPLDMDWLNGSVDADVKIARAFRVPGQKLGIPGSQTYANMEQANRALSEDNIVPFGFRIFDKLNTKLAPLYGEGLELLIDVDSIPAMRDSQDSLYNRANTAWWITVNQKLTMTGYEEIGPKGDVIMVPAGLIPFDMAMTPRTPDTGTGAGDNGNGDGADNTGDDQGAGADDNNGDGAVSPFASVGY